jgi:hypothetical protein
VIEFKKLEKGVEMYVDKKFIGAFPTQKRGRLYASGERDIDGKKIDTSSESANQKIEEPIKKRPGRKKKVGINDRREPIQLHSSGS